jgi:hypothetical protein
MINKKMEEINKNVKMKIKLNKKIGLNKRIIISFIIWEFYVQGEQYMLLGFCCLEGNQ